MEMPLLSSVLVLASTLALVLGSLSTPAQARPNFQGMMMMTTRSNSYESILPPPPPPKHSPSPHPKHSPSPHVYGRIINSPPPSPIHSPPTSILDDIVASPCSTITDDHDHLVKIGPCNKNFIDMVTSDNYNHGHDDDLAVIRRVRAPPPPPRASPSPHYGIKLYGN